MRDDGRLAGSDESALALRLDADVLRLLRMLSWLRAGLPRDRTEEELEGIAAGLEVESDTPLDGQVFDEMLIARHASGTPPLGIDELAGYGNRLVGIAVRMCAEIERDDYKHILMDAASRVLSAVKRSGRDPWAGDN